MTLTGCRVDELAAVLAASTDRADYPHAADVVSDVLVYSPDGLRAAPASELVRALADGPGIVLVPGAMDARVVERASAEFAAMVTEQRAAGARARPTWCGAHCSSSGHPRRWTPS